MAIMAKTQKNKALRRKKQWQQRGIDRLWGRRLHCRAENNGNKLPKSKQRKPNQSNVRRRKNETRAKWVNLTWGY